VTLQGSSVLLFSNWKNINMFTKLMNKNCCWIKKRIFFQGHTVPPPQDRPVDGWADGRHRHASAPQVALIKHTDKNRLKACFLRELCGKYNDTKLDLRIFYIYFQRCVKCIENIPQEKNKGSQCFTKTTFIQEKRISLHSLW